MSLMPMGRLLRDEAGIIPDTPPSLMFTPEEIANIRCMLHRSDWCCAVTNKMRKYLARPEVIEYLENNDD